jgi:hypothetical protein
MSGAVLIWISLVSIAAAQTKPDADAKWEVEFHAGAMAANHSTAGVGTLPAPGPDFTTVEGTPSRYVKSWLIGDGALLLNQVQALDPSSPYRITPLDSTLTSAILRRESSGVVGLRLSRRLIGILSAEVSAEYCICRLSLKPEVSAGVEASRASFESTWNAFFADWKSNSPVDPAGAIASSRFDDNRHGGEFFFTGALNVALRSHGKWIPYVTVGAGKESHYQGTPIVTLTGAYGIQKVASTSPFVPSPNVGYSEIVTMHFDASPWTTVGVVGGGIKYNLDSHWGLRLDARMHLGRDSVDTLVDTSAPPNLFPRIPPMIIPNTYVFGGDPSIQISNSIQGPRDALLKDFRTWHGNGLQQSVIVSGGVFRKF